MFVSVVVRELTIKLSLFNSEGLLFLLFVVVVVRGWVVVSGVGLGGLAASALVCVTLILPSYRNYEAFPNLRLLVPIGFTGRHSGNGYGECGGRHTHTNSDVSLIILIYPPTPIT